MWVCGGGRTRHDDLQTSALSLVNFSLCFNIEQDEMLPSNSHQKLFEVEVFRAICEAFLYMNVLTTLFSSGVGELSAETSSCLLTSVVQ